MHVAGRVAEEWGLFILQHMETLAWAGQALSQEVRLQPILIR